MPSYPQPANQYFGNTLKGLKQGVAANASSSTTYIVDPTILNPSPTNPNCMLIMGDVTVDNFGNSTGLPATSARSKWGLAVYDPATLTWSQA